MKVLFDCNVLLDVGVNRQPWFPESAAALQCAEEFVIQGYVAWHSIATIDYVANLRAATDARPFITELVEVLRVPSVGQRDIELALRMPMTDLEDAMQVAAAVACGADRIVTRNTKHFKASIVPAVTPAELLAELGGEKGSK